MTTQPHTPNLDELHAQLAVTVDPQEYDRLQAAIRETEKAAHLTKAQVEVNRRAQAAAERQAKLTKHEADSKTLAAKPAEMLALDVKIFKALAKLHDLFETRHELTQATRVLHVEVRRQAEELELPEPVAPVDPNNWTDRYDLEAFAKSWVQRYIENHREATKIGADLTLDLMTATTVNLAGRVQAKDKES